MIDNTNPTVQDRSKYIGPAKHLGYRILGIQIDIPIEMAIARNNARNSQKPIQVGGIYNTFKKMQQLSLSEGFDEIILIKFSLHERPEVVRIVK